MCVWNESGIRTTICRGHRARGRHRGQQQNAGDVVESEGAIGKTDINEPAPHSLFQSNGIFEWQRRSSEIHPDLLPEPHITHTHRHRTRLARSKSPSRPVQGQHNQNRFKDGSGRHAPYTLSDSREGNAYGSRAESYLKLTQSCSRRSRSVQHRRLLSHSRSSTVGSREEDSHNSRRCMSDDDGLAYQSGADTECSTGDGSLSARKDSDRGAHKVSNHISLHGSNLHPATGVLMDCVVPWCGTLKSMFFSIDPMFAGNTSEYRPIIDTDVEETRMGTVELVREEHTFVERLAFIARRAGEESDGVPLAWLYGVDEGNTRRFVERDGVEVRGRLTWLVCREVDDSYGNQTKLWEGEVVWEAVVATSTHAS
ncbi:hypothetical protein BJ508DRAFT_316355 [Ascobolus immersus RN42]|uniref:Uncharacterized protein n=1 Tax=Ascobolus immersus RN42 TaxID=1160509 RepID=A0A3N4HEL7_ASCIM|nr:hypothetical protein BJ508DRAFT_316355 [Ascobolus immersus RN42]